MRPSPIPLLSSLLLPALAIASHGPESEPPAPLPGFERIVIDDDFPGGYQVEVADVNGDGRPDIVALGGGTCAWYENPSWRKRIITGPESTPGIISSATADIDGDGKAEVAIAYDFVMRDPSKGELALAIQGDSPEGPWTIRRLGHFGSIHRARWADLDGDDRLDLVVAPIFGPDARPPTFDQSPAELVALLSTGPAGAPAGAWEWSRRSITTRPVIHAIAVVGGGPDRPTQVLTADNLGVCSTTFVPARRAATVEALYPGAPGPVPDRGSSEIHPLRFPGSLATTSTPPSHSVVTIEPWHGSQVVHWRRTASPSGAGFELTREVLDDSLDQGHALWVADVNGDGFDEVFAGHRGTDHRVSAYHFDGNSWDRTVLDRSIAAQDLRGGDLDGDGTPDIVAIGGATHNVIWYRPLVDGPP